MDKVSFREAILADFIMEVESWSRERLLQELISMKHSELESATDGEVITKLHEDRSKKN